MFFVVHYTMYGQQLSYRTPSSRQAELANSTLMPQVAAATALMLLS